MGQWDYAIVTGATISPSGLDTIGSGIAKALAAERYTILIAARDEARLALLRGQLITLGASHVDIVASDLSTQQGAEDIFLQAQSYPKGSLTLFDNAGEFMLDTAVQQLDSETLIRKTFLSLHAGRFLATALDPAHYVKTSSSAEVTPYTGGMWYRDIKREAAHFALEERNEGRRATWIAQPSNVMGDGTRARGIPDGNTLDPLSVGRWVTSLVNSPSFASMIIPTYGRDTKQLSSDAYVERRDVLIADLPFNKTKTERLCAQYDALTAVTYQPLVLELLRREELLKRA